MSNPKQQDCHKLQAIQCGHWYIVPDVEDARVMRDSRQTLAGVDML